MLYLQVCFFLYTQVARDWRPGTMKRKQKGFSLIELLIVVAVILILAAIAIPNLIQSRMTANEASAVQTLRDINTAEPVYGIQFGAGFSLDLKSLGGTSGTSTPTN